MNAFKPLVARKLLASFLLFRHRCTQTDTLSHILETKIDLKR